MRTTTRVGLALVAVAVLSLVVSAGAFSSTEADRAVSVDVVGDEDAYMGLAYEDRVADDSNTDSTFPDGVDTHHNVTLVTIGNHFGGTMDQVSATIEVESDDGVDATIDREPSTVAIGEEQDVYIDVTCPEPESTVAALAGNQPPTATVSFDVETAGDGFSAETTSSRSIEVTCEGLVGDASIEVTATDVEIGAGQGLHSQDRQFATISADGGALSTLLHGLTIQVQFPEERIASTGNSDGIYVDDGGVKENLTYIGDNSWELDGSVVDSSDEVALKADFACLGKGATSYEANITVSVASGSLTVDEDTATVSCNPGDGSPPQ